MQITKMDARTIADAEGNDMFWVERTMTEYGDSKVFTATFWDANGNAAWDDAFFENFKSAEEMDACISEHAAKRGLVVA